MIEVQQVQYRSEEHGDPCARVLAEVAEHQMAGAQAILVTGMPTGDNGPFISLARHLGEITTEGAKMSGHPLEDGAVFRIEARGAGVLDDEGALVYSTTDREFPCHSDGFCRKEPISLVLMLCVEPSGTGGDSLLVGLPDLLARLDQSTRSLLRDPVFGSLGGAGPILFGPPESPCIRFNEREVARARTPLDRAHRAALDQVAEACRSPSLQRRLRLRRGDCLVVDNLRTLHGRTALSASAGRLLKRLWVRERTTVSEDRS